MITKLPSTILDNIAKQHRYIAQSSTSRRTIKLEKGQSWLIRFIPSLMGPDKTFYARVAKHWMFKQAVVCPRHTDTAFGGSPDTYCPACEVAETLMHEDSKPVADFAYRCRATSQWLVWCIVLEKENGVAEPLAEILNPYEFWMYKTTYDEFTGFFKTGLRKSPELSIFDYEIGNDFVISRNKKGVRLDKQDSGPIFDKDDPKFEKNVNKIEAAIKDPKPIIPKEKVLNDFADKLEENCLKAATDGNRGRRDEEGDEEDAPERRPRTRTEDEEERPTHRHRTAPAMQEDEDEEEEEAKEPPTRGRAQRTNQRDEEEERPRVRQPTAEQPPPTRRTRSNDDGEDDDDGDVAPQKPQPSRRITQPPAAARRPASESEDEEQADDKPVRQRRAAVAPSRTERGSTDDEEDTVPEEASDQAPPTKESTDEDTEEQEAPLTNIARPSSRPAPSARLMSRIRQASAKNE